jgi:hypothetical protein
VFSTQQGLLLQPEEEEEVDSKRVAPTIVAAQVSQINLRRTEKCVEVRVDF